MKEYTVEEQNDETRRYYLSLKATKAECNYGSKNCDTCQKNKECKLYEFVR